MRIVGRWMLVGAVLVVLLAAGIARADNNPNGMVFRAAGWFKGRADISTDSIHCDIPTVSTAIADGVFETGLWNTFGFPTIYFPDINNPFGNPCGVWIQLQNNLLNQAIQVDHIALNYKILGARRFRQFVPTRNGFPIACRPRNDTLFIGAVVNPINSTLDQSGSGRPNVTFVELIPFVTPQMINCLRSQYAPLSTDVFTSFSLIIRATVFGVSDTGDTFRANPISYTLNLRHTCGNGRVDDGEQCDPNAPSTCAGGLCVIPQGQTSGTCSTNPNRACLGNLDCQGTCSPPDNPTECVCVY